MEAALGPELAALFTFDCPEGVADLGDAPPLTGSKCPGVLKGLPIPHL